MRLMIAKSKNAQSLYAIKSVYDNRKRSTKIVEKLGTLAELQKIHKDPISWANEYIKPLTIQEKNQLREVIIKKSQSKRDSFAAFHDTFNLFLLFYTLLSHNDSFF